jgi:hypothetical protein
MVVVTTNGADDDGWMRFQAIESELLNNNNNNNRSIVQQQLLDLDRYVVLVARSRLACVLIERFGLFKTIYVCVCAMGLIARLTRIQ